MRIALCIAEYLLTLAMIGVMAIAGTFLANGTWALGALVAASAFLLAALAGSAKWWRQERHNPN